MSASVTTSSRRRPAHAISSSSEENLMPRALAPVLAADASCEQTLQNHPRSVRSSIEGSSQPHFGQTKAWLAQVIGPARATLAIALPASCRNPLTYRSPSLIEPSASTVHSQFESCTSIG